MRRKKWCVKGFHGPKVLPAASAAVEFWDMTNRQDRQLCEMSRKGISARAWEPGPYVDL